MKTAVVALTKNGSKLALALGRDISADVYVKKEFADAGAEGGAVKLLEGSLQELMSGIFHQYDALVCIMASGIVVRTIAPYIRDKRSDPAVLVMDEKGRFVISLLSGHIGGANRLAGQLAEKTGGIPVITTATDVNGVIAFDVFAQDNDCVIENIEAMKYISGELVNGGTVGLWSDCAISGSLPEHVVPYEEGKACKAAVAVTNQTQAAPQAERVLYLRPRNLILGVGCKRGTSKEQFLQAFPDFMQRNGRSRLSLRGIATVEVKKDEEGLLEFCRELGLPLFIIRREEIASVQDHFTASDFVRETIGVGSVAEPCAVLAGHRAKLICKKTVYRGITLALAEEEKVLQL